MYTHFAHCKDGWPREERSPAHTFAALSDPENMAFGVLSDVRAGSRVGQVVPVWVVVRDETLYEGQHWNFPINRALSLSPPLSSCNDLPRIILAVNLL